MGTRQYGSYKSAWIYPSAIDSDSKYPKVKIDSQAVSGWKTTGSPMGCQVSVLQVNGSGSYQVITAQEILVHHRYGQILLGGQARLQLKYTGTKKKIRLTSQNI